MAAAPRAAPPAGGVECHLARSADLPQISAIYDAAVVEGNANCDLGGLSAAERQAWFEQHRGPHAVFVARVGERVLGWVALSPYDPKPCFARTATISTYV